MLNVSSARRSAVAGSDLTARARIRDAAVEAFAAEGFGVGLRAIAARADVSPALVLHHFGSKDGLVRSCHDHVLEAIRHEKESAIADRGPEAVLMSLASVEESAPLVAYTLRSLQTGGELARSFIEHFAADAEEWLAAGVAAGTLRPSRDEKARARYLTLQGFGVLLLDYMLEGPADPAAVGGYLRSYLERHGLVSLELFSGGLFTDRRMLDAYLLYVGDPPSGGPQ